MAFIFGKGRFEPVLKGLFIVNGICRSASALITSVDMKWLFTPAGLTALVVWNTLVLVIDFYLLVYFKKLIISQL